MVKRQPARRSKHWADDDAKPRRSKRSDRFPPAAAPETVQFRPPLPTRPRTHLQGVYLENLSSSRVNIALGPAGTGKTFLAVCHALDEMADGAVEKLIFIRPPIEAANELGFLPGDMKEKLDPFMRPLYDAVEQKLSRAWLEHAIRAGRIELCSLGHLRGATLRHACVILDEAQNCTFTQLKMVITRMGEGTSMVFSGDADQVDLPDRADSGLPEFAARLRPSGLVAITEFGPGDVVRDPLLAKLVPYL